MVRILVLIGKNIFALYGTFKAMKSLDNGQPNLIFRSKLSALSAEKSLKVEDPDGIFSIEKANGCRIPIKKTDEVP